MKPPIPFYCDYMQKGFCFALLGGGGGGGVSESMYKCVRN